MIDMTKLQYRDYIINLYIVNNKNSLVVYKHVTEMSSDGVLTW